MEISAYTNIENTITKRGSCIYFFKQLFVCSGAWAFFFAIGQNYGAPTVYIPQVRREANSSSYISEEMASWLYSVPGFAAVPWLFILAFLSQYIGRKGIFILANINMLIAMFTLYFSTTPVHLLVSQLIIGMCCATSFTNNIILITEYASPKYRGMFLAVKSTTIFSGMWASNAIGTFFHWKYIVVVGFVLCVYGFTAFSWPESPHWLASKGRFDECRTAFIWLNGSDERSMEELQALIDSYSENLSTRSTRRTISNRLKSINCVEFYKPILISGLLIIQYQTSGKFVCSIYAIDMLKKMTNSEPAAYIGMLILDGVTVSGMYIGCILARFLKRRKLYLTSSAIGITFLFIISLYLYLIKLSLFNEDKRLSILLLMCFSIAISCGPMTLNTSIYGEILPSRFKSIGILFIGLLFQIITALTLKLAPLIFKTMGLHGAFLFYGITTGLCFILLYKYLPETKDKTLQEIEELFKNMNRNSINTEKEQTTNRLLQH